MSFAFVQGNQADAGSVASATLLLGTATAGNNILVTVLFGLNSGSLVITDNLGNTYATDDQINDATSTIRLYLFRATGIAAGSTTLTATVTGGPASVRWVIAEYSSSVGPLALDKKANAVGTTATTLSSGNAATTAVAAELLVGYFRTNTTKTFTATGSFTGRGTANKVFLEDKVVAATGAYNATCTISAADTRWNAAVATYYEAAAAPTFVAPRPYVVGQAVPRAAYY